MAGITKQKRSYMNKPIGVTRFETGETQMWESVANAATTLNQIAVVEGTKQAEQSGMDAAMAVSQANLIGFDAETGAPKALDPSLFTGGLVAKEAYNRIVQSRFGKSIETELTNKAKELQTKYRYNPKEFREEMSRYVGEMHKNAQGKWKETVKVAGTAIVNSTSLFIEAKAKEKQDMSLGNFAINSANDVLNKEIPNIFSANGFVNGFPKALEVIEENYQNLLDGATVNKDYVVPFEAAEEFRTKAFIKLGVRKLQFEVENPENLIPLGVIGNKSRTNLLVALQNQNPSQLSPTEKTVYDKIYSSVEENPSLLQEVVKSSEGYIEQQNKNAIDNQYQNNAIRLSTFNKKSTQYSDNINEIFARGLHITELDNSILKTLEELENDLEINTIMSAGLPSKQPELKMMKAKIDIVKESLARNIINQLVMGERAENGKESESIKYIRSILENPAADISGMNKKNQKLISFFRNKNLNTTGFEKIFNNSVSLFATKNARKKQEQIKLSYNLKDEFGLIVTSSSYEETLEKSKEFLGLLEGKGSLNLLDSTNRNQYKNSINALLIDKSSRRLNFSSTEEVSLARIYLNETDKTALDDLPEIKRIIDETLQIKGANFNSLNANITRKNNILIKVEAQEAAEEKRKVVLNEIDSGGYNNTEHKAVAEQALTKLTDGKSHREVLLNQNNLEYFNQLDYFVTKSVVPNSLKTIFELAASNQGDFSDQEFGKVLMLWDRYTNGVHLKNAQSVDFLYGKGIDTKAIAILETASNLSDAGGSDLGLDFIIKSRDINSGKYDKEIQNVLGIKTVSDSDIEGFISSIKIGDDILKDRIATEMFTDVAKYAALSGMTKPKIEELIEKKFNKIFVKTEGYVKDYANSNSDRSRFALSVVFPEPELKEEFIRGASEELELMGYRFGEVKVSDVDIRFEFSIDKVIKEKRKKRKAVLIPMEMGTAGAVMYLAYEQDQTSGQLTLIRKILNEAGDSEPLVFSSKEGYLNEKREEIRISNKIIDANLVAKAEESRRILSKGQQTTQDAGILGNTEWEKILIERGN